MPRRHVPCSTASSPPSPRPAPDWATPGKSSVDRPNATEFGKFVRAVGTRFSTVKIWSIWNEPNLSSWLSPQVKGGVPQSPRPRQSRR